MLRVHAVFDEISMLKTFIWDLKLYSCNWELDTSMSVAWSVSQFHIIAVRTINVIAKRPWNIHHVSMSLYV